MADSFGYRYGSRVLVSLPVDSSSSDITAGDIITEGSAGYVQQAAAGSNVVRGVAVESASSPSSEGGVSILVDISEASVYEFPPDTGSATAAQAGKTCDVGGARSINVDATADDNVIIHSVDTDANSVLVSFKIGSTFQATGT